MVPAVTCQSNLGQDTDPWVAPVSQADFMAALPLVCVYLGIQVGEGEAKLCNIKMYQLDGKALYKYRPPFISNPLWWCIKAKSKNNLSLSKYF